MHVTSLAINHSLGITLAPADSEHLLELDETPLVLNHLGTIHASAQFALAEACSGEFLLSQLGERHSSVLAVLRSSSIKFRKPANGRLRAKARFAEGHSIPEELAARGRALVGVIVELTSTQGVTMGGQFDWFLQASLSTREADHPQA